MGVKLDVTENKVWKPGWTTSYLLGEYILGADTEGDERER
jgi:hypothetical protein